MDWGAALGDREEVRKGIEGYGRERRKLLMLKEAEIRANGWSLFISAMLRGVRKYFSRRGSLRLEVPTNFS